mmetsp:Transcript_24608/g.56819  ORF Transcript_24608/g.56819 Transcript_24608/m.56819 type:complete len:210 (-) Transcript_24608:627-1256(-)
MMRLRKSHSGIVLGRLGFGLLRLLANLTQSHHALSSLCESFTRWEDEGHHTHVITRAPLEAITHHLLAHETRRRLALLTVAGHLFGRLFVRHDVPDAVTRQDHELISFRALHDRDVRERRHLGVLRIEIGILKLKVTKGTRHCELTIHTLHRYTTARRLNPILLLRVVWFVVFAKSHRLRTHLHRTARVTRVRHDYVRGRDHRCDGSTA